MSDLVKRLRDQWSVTDNMLEAIDRIEQLERELADQINRKIGYYNKWIAERAMADELHADLVHSGISMNRTILKYRKARGL